MSDDEPTIRDAAEATDNDVDGSSDSESVSEVSSGSGNVGDRALNVLKAPRKEESLDYYEDHTLNFDGTKSTARILRGLEGMIGNFDLAIVDLLMGVFQKAKEMRGGSNGEE